MLFSKRKNNLPGEINVRINNSDIQSVTGFNFLGLYLNSKLNWDTHVNVIGKKISRAVDIIKKMQLLYPKRLLISWYITRNSHIIITAYFHGDRVMLQNLFFFGKRRLYALFHPLVIMHILNHFSTFLTF